MAVIKNSLGQSHDIIQKLVSKGDVAIDATAGNGNDTAFLASLVGDTGIVYSFDIQERALKNTEKKLKAAGISSCVRLINDGHQNMDKHVTQRAKAVMFNLGYLPGGDHSIGTRGETTIEAIKKAMDLIQVHGIIAIVVYYGGHSGFDEKNQVVEFVNSVDNKRFTVMKTEFVNQPNCPPILICIEKLS